MNKQWMVLAVLAVLASPQGLLAQKGAVDSLASVRAELGLPVEKSPFAAGAMSWFLPGLGSFYAGNEGHGIRHLGIGIGSAALVFATAGDCNFFGESGPGCGVAVMSYLVFVTNSIWSIFTAKNDAIDYNESLQTAGLRIEPRLVAFKMGSESNVGVELLRFDF